jgi:membrane associated rhomboid family serine protease
VIPIRDTTPTRRAAIVTVLLIAVNILVFLHEVGLPPRMLEGAIEVFGVVPARFTRWVSLGGAPWDPYRFLPLVSSMFLHGGWLHVLGNMWFLWIFGDNVEDVLGRLRYLLFYLLCGIAAALAQVAASPGSLAPTIGASGAIAGVLGAYFITFPRARVLTLIPVFIFPWFVELPAVVFLGLWFVLQLFHSVLGLGGAAGAGIAWWAHAAGFVTGIVLMLLLRPRRRTAVRAAQVW